MDNQNWIDVKDRLPTNTNPVLGYDGHDVGMCQYVKDSQNWLDFTWENYLKITHWLPLPQPPKEKHNG